MTPAKQVTFSEKIEKTQLGLKGLQTVVYCDKCRKIDATKEDITGDQYSFLKTAQKIIKEINGDYIQKKYKLKPGKEFGKKLHEERVKWFKKNIDRI